MEHWKMLFTVSGSSEKTDCLSFEMIIDNFSKFKDSSYSPTFTTTRDFKTTWQIIVEVDIETSKMRVGLKRIDLNTCSVTASMFFEIQNDKKEIYLRDSIEHFYHFQNSNCCFGEYIERPSDQQYVSGINYQGFKLSSDKIIIKGSVLLKEKNPKYQYAKVHDEFASQNYHKLKSDFLSLYYKPKFSDIEFRFGDGKLLAHKNVLCSRSPVFERIFEQNYHQDVIEITDIEKSVFHDFLVFLYSGVVENADVNVTCLYSLGHKYEVLTLCRTCGRILEKSLTAKTVVSVLELAIKYDDIFLKERAIHFICENFSCVSETSEWDIFLENNPVVASLVLKKFSKKMKTQK